MRKKFCLNCGIEIEMPIKCTPRRWKERKYCTVKCAMSSKEVRDKISFANKGKLVGDKNPFWKGGKVPKDLAKRREYSSDYNFERKYGTPVEIKKEKYFKQRGKCFFFEYCKNYLPPNWRKAIQDHDHLTGKLRNILCNSCNVAMAGVDYEEWLTAALEYRDTYRKR